MHPSWLDTEMFSTVVENKLKIAIIFGILVVLLTFFIKISKIFQFHAKMLLYYVLVMGLAAVTFPYGLLHPFRPENYRILAAVIPWLLTNIFALEVEVRGSHHMGSDKPFILLLNHQSSLDAFVMMCAWPDRCVALMKKELMYFFPFGTTAWLFGSLFIDRSSHKDALQVLEKAAQEIKEKNLKICMFPEGTRNHLGNLLPFKKGAFNLAVQAQVPIVPAVISSYKNFYNKSEHLFGSGKVIITVLPPVPTSCLTKDDVPKLTEDTRNSMVDVYKRTSAEVFSK